jgi:hypothetical protein
MQEKLRQVFMKAMEHIHQLIIVASLLSWEKEYFHAAARKKQPF